MRDRYFWDFQVHVVLHNVNQWGESSSHRSVIMQRFNYFKMIVGTGTPSATCLSAVSAPGCPPASLTSSSATPWRSCPQSRPWLSSCASRHWLRGWGWHTLSSLPTIWCSWGTSGPGHTDRSAASCSCESMSVCQQFESLHRIKVTRNNMTFCPCSPEKWREERQVQNSRQLHVQSPQAEGGHTSVQRGRPLGQPGLSGPQHGLC